MALPLWVGATLGFACAGAERAVASAGHERPTDVLKAISSDRRDGGVMRSARHADLFRRRLDLFPRSRYPSVLKTATVARMPSHWCGTPRATDNTRDAVSDEPQVKVVYAYARGAPNRFHAYKDLIQQDVAAARSLVASASRGRKTIRFDMGTDCAGGERFVDIQIIRLPHEAAHYGFEPGRASRLLGADVARLLRLRGTRNTTTYADAVMPGNVTGIASQPLDESPGPRNEANRGGQQAFVFGDGSEQFAFERTRAFIHETAHNLGAVQDGAPHATGAGHCFDGEDVMCYRDGGPSLPGAFPDAPCPGYPRFDCGGDDYFHPAPARGSYLRSHWNLFRSVFMCELRACARPAAGSRKVLRSSLRHALRALAGTVRRSGLHTLAERRGFRLAFRFPHPGTVRIRLSVGRRIVAAGARTNRRSGPAVVRVRVAARGRKLVASSGFRVAIRLSFIAATRKPQHSSMVVRARR